MTQRAFKFNNKYSFIFWFLVGSLLFLASFFVSNYSLAADDNANENRCVNYVADCDNNQDSCSYFNFDWVADGYPGGAGNPSCCGDDSQEYYSDGQNNLGTTGCCSSNNEYYLSCHATSNNFCSNGQESDTSDSLCSTDNRGCVYKGVVYQEYSLVDVADDSNDLEWCHGAAITSLDGESGNAWDDQDYVIFDGNNYIAGYCQYTPLVGNCDNAGPNGTCDDSDNNPDNGYCCGDDANENYVSTDCDGGSVSLCCPDDKPYVKNGVCVANCPTGCGDNSYNGTDYDDSQNHCDSVATFRNNGCDYVSSAWGWSNGDASSSCWQSGSDDPYLCCGDDSNEHIVTLETNGVDNMADSLSCDQATFAACCSHNSDCVDFSSNCYNLNYVGDVFGTGHQAICKGDDHNYWKDPDTYYADAGASVCGSASGVYAGESGVGMYDNTTTLECCGDDTGEYYANLANGVTGDRKCCDSSADLIVADGTCDHPPVINLSSPSNASSCQAQTGIALNWTASDNDNQPNPLQYHIYFSTNQNLVSNHDASVLVATVSSNSYSTGSLSYNTTYYWTVLADDGALQTASEVWSFSTQKCDSSLGCCQTDGCDFVGAGGQPWNQTDGYSCTGNVNCGGSCDIAGDDYYCQADDATVYLNSGPTGVTCDSCESWDNADGCDLCAGNECGANHSCTTDHCSDPVDPDGSGDADPQSYYQTRTNNCLNCTCPAWGPYETCQDSYNNCVGTTRVECYQGVGCNTANNACYCETGYNPDGSGGCVSDGTYPIVDFDWCLSSQTNTVQFIDQTTGGTLPYSSYSWNFGDGSCPGNNDCSESDPLHIYSSSASYNVTLNVIDSASHQAYTTKTVDLNASGKDCPTPFNFNSINSQSSSQLYLNWDYSLGNSNYNIYRSDNGGVTYTQITNPAYSCDINNCTYTDIGLNAGSEYYYYIVAADSDTYDSTVSPSCTGGQGGPICPLSAYTKSNVSGLNVTSDSCGLIKVEWNDLGADYTYKVYRRADSAENITTADLITTVGRSYCSGGKCVYNDDEIIPEQAYYYKVTSYSVNTGESALNDALSGTASSYCFRGSNWGEK